MLAPAAQQNESTIHVHISPPFGVSLLLRMGFPGGSAVNNPPANAGDTGLIPESGRSPGVGNGKPLLYFCLGNPIHGVAKESDTA